MFLNATTMGRSSSLLHLNATYMPRSSRAENITAWNVPHEYTIAVVSGEPDSVLKFDLSIYQVIIIMLDSIVILFGDLFVVPN